MARVRSNQLCKRLAVAAADRALQGGQVLAEALQQFQHRLAVGEKDVAPHHRVGGRDPGEVAEAAGGIGDDLGLQVLGRARSRCRRSYRRSDAAGARSPPAPCRGDRRPSSRPACRPAPTAGSPWPPPRARSRAAASGCTSGRGTTRRSRLPGPECSVPATGWPGTKCTRSGNTGRNVSIAAPLTEPTSVTIAPSRNAGAIRRPISA